MTVSPIQLQRLQGLTPGDGPRPSWTAPGAGGGFADTLRDAIGQVDASQKTADGQIEAFVAGEQENLHEVTIAMNEARLHFQLMTEVRNKSLETYQELMRMQV
ncbi:flagellar hook-basal body complex protein FliE [Rubrivirga sp. S365]|uniref:Flagellar hook-basal body complex protein FliE n=1 Tax=Rubrivirga litoralis TaxID=3075598 RepID=A0ABU3BSU5_9BACT|nr:MULTISPECIES: flagellar hook-basal body complex protein FliE [unclassified Rubrivirga]MDT0632359.1 flagellar hook-basal body complex protein FliE [Rubrivirga sp. F394]MDT7857325.1 flagellar hook-basal body complex protein FliE [Rubrivirga sp. S365]